LILIDPFAMTSTSGPNSFMINALVT
jgi:hypothetical protein